MELAVLLLVELHVEWLSFGFLKLASPGFACCPNKPAGRPVSACLAALTGGWTTPCTVNLPMVHIFGTARYFFLLPYICIKKDLHDIEISYILLVKVTQK